MKTSKAFRERLGAVLRLVPETVQSVESLGVEHKRATAMKIAAAALGEGFDPSGLEMVVAGVRKCMAANALRE